MGPVMASSHQLKAGNRGPAATVRSEWLAFNLNIGKSVKTLQNQSSNGRHRFLSVCHTAEDKGWRKTHCGCRAHINHCGESPDDCDIVSCNLIHTCSSENERKRNFKTEEIASVSDAVALCQPASTGDGNAEQLANIAKASTGVDMRPGQAHKAAHRSAMDTVEAQLGQCMMIPSLFEFVKKQDPGGSHELEITPCVWDHSVRQFKQSCVCLSSMKRFWEKALMRLIVTDGTHTKCPGFEHIVLVAVTFDGNNNIVILAFAVVDLENSSNWVWFQEHLQEDFPGFNVAMADADEGTTIEAFSPSQTEADALTSRCARHISENCRESCGFAMNEGHKPLIVSLAKARTEAVHSVRLEAIRAIHSEWADWLDQRKFEFVACTFLQRDVQRWGKATGNAVENINGALLEARQMPTLFLHMAIIDKSQGIHRKGNNDALRWLADKKEVCPCAAGEQGENVVDAVRRKVVSLEEKDPHHSAKVATGLHSGLNGFLNVEVIVDEHDSKCPCLFCQENGGQCEHVLAVSHHHGVSATDKWWFDQRCHVLTCAASHEAVVPSLAPAGRLAPDPCFSPPDFKRPAGRPTKKRKDRSCLNKTDRKNQCKACGVLGHGHRTCAAPDTQFRCTENREKAHNWAVKHSEIDCETKQCSEECLFVAVNFSSNFSPVFAVLVI